MTQYKHNDLSRRSFLKATAVGAWAAPSLCLGKIGVAKPLTRPFGQTGFDVTTMGLGGQASLQWTPADVDPVPIIIKAFESGVNYFDTSNGYGPSQVNYGKAFRRLGLVPGRPGYDEKKRRSTFLASKTYLRCGKGQTTDPKVRNFSDGPGFTSAVQDLKRTLSQVFGDGRGNYPKEAYVDLFQMHTLWTMEDVDAIYEGLDNPDPKAERIGALAAMLDYRDGTNRTGLNPKEEKLIRHLGFSGHHSPPVMIECIQRDKNNILDTMLVGINANDRLVFNQQYNAMPVAAAKNMGIIAMKLFADGAMYGKGAHWSTKPEHVVMSVGGGGLPSRPLVEYSLTVPGVSTAIIGIGHVDNDARACQLQQDLSAAQVRPDALTQSDRRTIEKRTARVKDGKTNWFQIPPEPLSPPRDSAVVQQVRDGKRSARLTWQTAYAGPEPISRYEILRDGRKIGQVPYRPQTTKEPFAFDDGLSDRKAHNYKLVTIDASGQSAATKELLVEATG